MRFQIVLFSVVFAIDYISVIITKEQRLLTGVYVVLKSITLKQFI